MKNLTLLIALFLFNGQILMAQKLPNETMRAIYEGNTELLDKEISEETLDDCFEVKENTYTYLAMCIKMKQQTSLEYFIDKGADLEAVCTGKTPLMYAAKYGQLEMVKYLIEKGANPDTETTRGKTALDYAVKYEQDDIAKFLKSL